MISLDVTNDDDEVSINVVLDICFMPCVRRFRLETVVVLIIDSYEEVFVGSYSFVFLGNENGDDCLSLWVVCSSGFRLE